jgi:hypothetical protein
LDDPTNALGSGGAIVFGGLNGAVLAGIKGYLTNGTSPISSGNLNFYTGSSGSGLVQQMTVLANGNVGIGAPGPLYKLDVAGQIRSSSGGIVFPDSSTQTTAYTPADAALLSAFTFNSSNGNIGINTNNQIYPLTVNGNILTNSTANNAAVLLYTSTVNVNGTPEGFGGIEATNSAANEIVPLILQQFGGAVGIGTTIPNAKLEVNGNAQIDGPLQLNGSNAAIFFPGNNQPQTQPYTGITCGGDYAESVDVAGDRKNYEPGDVLVIGAESGSDVLKSAEPYSTLVAGIYSTKPGTTGRRQTADAKTSTTEVPMAMVGIVPTKVSAENGSIKRGDLLVTSSMLGYAMKGTDRSKMLGAVVGKALGNLDSGTGVIEVLVSLQ